MTLLPDIERELLAADERLAASSLGVPVATPTRTTQVRRGASGSSRFRSAPAFALAACLALIVVATMALLPDRAAQRLGGRTIALAPIALAQAAEQRCAHPTGATGSAACLNALGAVAGDWEVPGHGDVLYQRQWWVTSSLHVKAKDPSQASASGEAGAYEVQRGAEKELWVAPDGSGQSLQLGEGAAFLPSADDRAAWIAAGRPALDQLGGPPLSALQIMTGSDPRQTWKAGDAPPDLFPVGELNDASGKRALLRTGNPVAEFSTNPTVLATQIRTFAWRQRVELSGDPACAPDLHNCTASVRSNIKSNEAITAVALLQYPGAPRTLRSAVLQMLARQPGYRTLGQATDLRGRPGIAVLLPDSAKEGNLLLLDTASARLLAVGTTPNRTLQSARWQQLFNLETDRVESVGDLP